MNDQRSLTTWVRLVLAACLATALGVAIGVSTQTGIAQAVDVAPPTLFEIDGDRLGPNDFADPYGPGLTPAPGSHPTTGLYYNQKTIDQGGASGCNLAADDTALGGIKLGDGPAWPTGGPNPNGKTDLDFIDLAAEKVDVNGQISDILYVGYQKCGGTGTWQAALYLDDGDGVTPTGGDTDGDYLFVFDFNPSSGAVTFFQYNRIAGAWVLQPINATFIKGLASGDYGEVALNLTGLKILDSNTARCSSITVSGPAAAITGGDLSSQVKDLLTFAPLTITNCGKMLVTKDSSPDGIVSTDTFHYALDQIDGKPSHAATAALTYASQSVETRPVGAPPSNTTEPDALYAEIDADIQIDEQHTWTNVISEPDYFLAETVVAANWARQTIQCTAANIFAAPVNGVYPLVTVSLPIAKPASYVAGAPDHFLVAPYSIGNIQLPPTTCTITNSTSGIIIAKNGAGSPTTFDFTVTGKPTQLVALGAQSALIPFAPNSVVTITELAETATPAWVLDSVDCDDPANAQRSGNGITVTTVAGSVITCTFTNTQAGRIIVQKTGSPNGGSFPFEQSWDGNTNTPADFTLAIPSTTGNGLALNSGDLPPGTYTVTELLSAYNATADPDFLGSASCSGESPIAATAGDVTATVNLAAGETVTCTFTNDQRARIIVDKTATNPVTGDTFDFTGALTGALAPNAAGDLRADVTAGTYTVNETAEPGYTLQAVTCTGDPTQNSTGNPAATPNASFDVAAGEVVTCTFNNVRNAGTLTILKSWDANVASGEAVNLDVTAVTNSVVGQTAIDAVATEDVPNTTGSTYAGANAMPIYSKQTISLEETFVTAANGANYVTSLACTRNGVAFSPTKSNGDRNAQFTTDDVPGDVVCTFTNARRQLSVRVAKQIEPSTDSGKFNLSINGTPRVTDAIDGSVSAPVAVSAGATVTVGEVAGTATNLANYSSQLVCMNDLGTTDPADDVPVTVTNNTGTGGSLVVPANSPPAAVITCTFTNTRLQANLVLDKSWGTSPIDQPVADAVALTISGGAATYDAGENSHDGNAANDDAADGVVYAGETINLNEAFTDGADANYDTTLSCTNNAGTLTYTVDALSGSLPILPADSGKTITCSFQNQRRSTTLTLEKRWVNGYAGATPDSVTLSIAGIQDDSDVAEAVASGPSAITSSVTVYAGEQVALAEAFRADNVGSYDVTEFSCGATPVAGWSAGADVDATVAIPSNVTANAPIACHVTNVRTTATFTLRKDWTDPLSGVPAASVALSASGSDPLPGSISTNSASPTDLLSASSANQLTIFSGETVSFSEAFDSAVNDARFDSTLECTGGHSVAAGTVAMSGQFLVAKAAPQDTVCTFTNTRRSTTLTLAKVWVNGHADATPDTATLAIDGAVNDDSDVAAAVADGTSAAISTTTVYAGETIALSEAFGAGNVGTYDVTGFSCGATAVTGWSGAADTTGSIVVADSPAPINCQITNTRTSAAFTLDKTWVDPIAAVSPASVQLTASGDDPLPGAIDVASNSPTASTGNTVTVYSGETVSFAEAFASAAVGDRFDSSLTCTGDLVTTDAPTRAGSYLVPADPAATSCEFTNTRKSTTLTLAKAWEKPHAGDTTTLSIDGVADDDSKVVTAPVTTPVASATVYAGETVTLSEAFGANNVASYDVSGLTCNGGSLTWTPGATSATLGVDTADIAEPISCTITNAAERGTIIVVKNVQGGDGTFSFNGNWTGGSAFDITTGTPNAGTGSVTFNDVLIGSYSVSEFDPTPAFDGTNVTCTDTLGGSGPVASATLPLTGTIDLDDDEVVTCTFTNTKRATIVVVKDAQPNAATDFGFTGALGAFTLDDDADATLSNTFTSALLPAQGQSYAVSETATPGWTLDLQLSSCSNGNTFSGSGVTVTPAPGTTVTCTFVNTANPAGISATKSVEGVEEPWGPFTFTLSSLSGGTFTGAPAQDVSNVDPKADWTDLVQGQTYTLVEAAEPGYVGGAAFTCQVILPGSQGAVALPDADLALAGFQFTAVAGAIYDCDITNVAIPPTLVVTKTTVGGTGSFTFDVTPTNLAYPVGPLTADTASGSPADTQTVDLQAGVGYTVAEQLSDAWVEGALTCTVTPADGSGTVAYAPGTITQPGDVIACSITNTKRAKITVVKQTVPDGAAGSFGFDASWLGAAPGADFSLVDGASSTSAFLDPDTEYSVNELAAAGFRLTAIECDSATGAGDLATSTATITPVPGEIVSCTFTNTQRGPVTIAKAAVSSVERTGTTYTVSYSLTVGSQSYIAEPFTLSDTPNMAANVAIQSMVVNGPGVTDKDLGATGGVVISSTVPARAGQPDGPAALVYTVVVTFTMTPSNTAQDCVTGQGGNGAFNSATVTFEEPPTTSTSTACVDLPKPDIDVTKTATSVAPNTDTPDLFDYIATYQVAVTNSGEAPGSYTIADIPDFGLGATEGTPVFAPVPGNPQLIGPDTTQNYTVTVPFVIAGSMSLDERTCSTEPYQSGEGGYNAVTVSYGPQPDPSDDTCIDLPPPAITVSKVRTADSAAAVAGQPNTYEATFTITVTNNGAGPGSYTLTDTPVLPAGANLVSTTITPTPVADTPIEAGGVDVYTAVVRFTVSGSLSLDDRDCIAGRSEPGDGAYNGVTVAWNGPVVDADDCVDIPTPGITVSKVRTADTAVAIGPNTYEATFTITVTNSGSGPGSYTLTDTPVLPAGANLVSTTITPTPVADTPIEASGVDVYTAVVRFTVSGSLSLDDRDCITGRSAPGEGAYNGVSVTWNGPTDSADDCVDIPVPNVTFSKTTAPAATRNADGTWTVVYTLTVANLGVADQAGPGQYTLTDTIDFGSNVTVNTITVDPVASGFTGVVPNDVIVTDVAIGHNETDVYTVTANVTINPVGANGDCTDEGGLYNRGSVQLATQEAPIADDACASYSTLTLVKQAPNDSGGNLPASAFTLTASQGETVVISGSTPASSAVMAGEYQLDESPRLDGYTITGFDCGDAAQEGDSVFVPLGANVTCTIVNDDNPVDLQITKADGGVTAIAGGAPFTYTISVSNIGTRDVDLGEPVTVTDQLPAGLVWVSFPANCTQSSQTLTCAIDPALLPAGGSPVVISATVRALADAPSGVVTNLVSVTTEDDPAPEQPSCSSESNNVDCEPTPIDREGAIQIVKTDDVADGATVQPNDTFSYSLVVTNTGVSTILPGAVVTDDLPAQLSLVSVVGGTGWTCNNVDPIECTYAPTLLPGAVAPAITVTVQVVATATGTSVLNTAVVLGAVDRDCLTPSDSLAEAFVPACNQVTDSDDETTPLVAQADLAIVKSASIGTVGAGGGFDWILDVTNNGPSAALNVVVGDIVPSSLTVITATSSQFSCSVTGNTVSCSKPSMAVGEKGQVTITVVVPPSAASGTITNIGTVESSTPDPNLTNNSDDASVTVVAQAAPTTTLPPVIIPPTGSNSTSLVITAAIVLILLGGGVVLLSRRRRDEQATAS